MEEERKLTWFMTCLAKEQILRVDIGFGGKSQTAFHEGYQVSALLVLWIC